MPSYAPCGGSPSRREGRKVARDGGGAARVFRDAPPESRGNCSLRSESRQGRLRFLLELFAVGVDPRPMAHSYSARLGTELGKSQLPDTISYTQRQGRVFDRVRPPHVWDQSIVPPGLGSQATAYPGFRRGYARKARAQPRLHPGLLSVPPCGREHKGAFELVKGPNTRPASRALVFGCFEGEESWNFGGYGIFNGFIARVRQNSKPLLFPGSPELSRKVGPPQGPKRVIGIHGIDSPLPPCMLGASRVGACETHANVVPASASHITR